jgi:hypothetical protein
VIQPERSTAATAAMASSSSVGRAKGRGAAVPMVDLPRGQLRATSHTPTTMKPMPSQRASVTVSPKR